MNNHHATDPREVHDGSRYGLLEPGATTHGIDPALLDRARGCLLGQVAGDALGGQVEFRSAERLAASHPDGVRELRDGGHWGTLAGQPTDDSEMALMLARALVAKGTFNLREVAAAYAHWYDTRPFDMGNTTRTALGPASSALARGGDPAQAARAAASTTSQANGALMRVSPLGVFGHATDARVLADWAREDAALTHPHALCRDASALFAVTIAHAVRTGEGPSGAFEFAKAWASRPGVHAEVRSALAEAEQRPPQDFFSQMGWVRIALHNAFYRLLHAPDLESGVVDTVMCGGDTDTTAAITGALLGAVYGSAVVPRQWRDAVLTCRPQPGLPGVRRPRPRDLWPVDVLSLAERLVVLGAAQTGAPASGT